MMKVVSLASDAARAPRPEAERAVDQEIDRVLAGDELAWHRLMGHCHQLTLAICRRRRLGGELGRQSDLHREVAERTLERVKLDDFAALRRYSATRDRHRETRFVHWLAAVVHHTFVDVLRALPEFERRRQGATRALVRREVGALDSEPGDLDARDPAVAAEIRRIVAVILEPDFPADQRRALLLWLEGMDGAETARELGLDGPRQATLLLNAARERLRRRFKSL